jgi:hypothetical protein
MLENRISFFIGHEVLFYVCARTLSANMVQITLRQRRRIGVMPKPTDREADYRCLSPLRRTTSELEFRTLHARFPKFT